MNFAQNGENYSGSRPSQPFGTSSSYEMRSFAFILLVLRESTSSNISTEVIEVMANVSLMINEEHSTRCIQIFRPDDFLDSERDTILKLWRVLAVPESYTTTGIYSFRRYVSRKVKKPWKVSCYKPLKVLLGGEGTKVGFSNLTNQLRVKDSVWLLFLDTDVNVWLREADLLFDCVVIVAKVVSTDLVILHEVYRVRKDYPLRCVYYGKWTRERGLEVVAGSLYERRSNLEGLVLRTGSIQNWPTTWKNGDRWDGFLPKIWSEIEEQTNSSSFYIESVDGMTGLKNPDNTWNGLVGMTVRGEIDMIVSEITIEKTRSHVLDLFHPLIYTSYQVYYRQLGYNLQWDSVFKPFGKSIWFAIIFWLFLGSTVISVCYYLSLMYGFEDDPEKIFSPARSFFFVLQTLSQQGHYIVPRSVSCRILFFLSYMVSAILIPSYSASLISYLTQQIPYRPFNTLEEMYKDGNYRLLIKENTAEYGYFKNAKNQLLKDIFKYQILTVPKDHQMINTSHAFTTLCNYPNYAFFGIEIIMSIRLGTVLIPTCPIITTTKPISSVYLTMGTIKNSPYSGLINHHLMKMMATGVARRIQLKEMPKNYQEPAALQREVALGEVFQIFVFVGLAVVMSVVILFMEKRYHTTQTRKQKKRVPSMKYPKTVKVPVKQKKLLPLFMERYDDFLN